MKNKKKRNGARKCFGFGEKVEKKRNFGLTREGMRVDLDSVMVLKRRAKKMAKSNMEGVR